MHNISFSIVIVNYQSQKNLEKCLASVLGKTKNIPAEIIVVNNDLNENLENISQKFPDVKIISARKNLGFGAGCNLGVSEANGEILFFLNPDTQIDLGNFSDISTLFQKNNNLGIVGANILTPEKTPQDWTHGPEMDIFNLIKNNLKINLEISPKADWVSGTALFIPKKIFQELGGFDEKFFMYFEDVDLGKRTRALGKKVLHFPNFSVIHLSGQSYTNHRLQKKHYYTSQQYYFKKHQSKWEYFLVKLAQKIFL